MKGILLLDYTRSRKMAAQEALSKDQGKSWMILKRDFHAEMVQVEIRAIIEEPVASVHPVVTNCARVFGVTVDDLFSTRYSLATFEARCAAYLIMNEMGMSLDQMAQALGRSCTKTIKKSLQKGKDHLRDKAFCHRIKKAMEVCIPPLESK